MKKIVFGLLLFFALTIPASAQIDDIQPDAINVNQFVDNETTSYAQITGEHVKSFDLNITINKDGTIDVIENIEYDFGDLSKHGIYRDIPFIKTNQDGKKFELKFSNFTVTDENRNSQTFVKSSINEEFIRLKIGDADRLITGIHTYVVSYQVSGALTYFSDHDELYWNVNGNQWTVPTEHITSEVVFPADIIIKQEDIKTTCFTGITVQKKVFVQWNYHLRATAPRW